MSQKQSKLDRNNPFLGLRPFSENERDYFKGRKKEITDILRHLKREVLTVLFGVSGLGKTSLLRAGLFPEARAEDYFPILIRLSFGDNEASGSEQIKAFVSAAIEKENIDAPKPEQNESLWTYFHRVQFWSARNELLTPILVFDQFEELFTLGQKSPGVKMFIDELASLIENRIPASEQQAIADAEELPFSIEQQNYRVILSLREDFLADLESLQKRIPSLGINRMRLLPMNGVASLLVVSQVPDLIQQDVAEQVVRFVAAQGPDTPLTDFEIEPALLSVFCRELNNKRLTRGDKQITVDLLKGSKEQILHDFYEKSVENFSKTVRHFIEEEMLTTTGYRNSVALEDALEHEGVTNEVISELINDRLVRVEERAGVKRIELTHDLLTREIKTSRDLRRSREAELAEAIARKRAEAEAEEVRKRAEFEAEKAKQKLRRSRVVGAGFFALCIVFLGIAIWAVVALRTAEIAEKQAIASEDKAIKAQVELDTTLRKAYQVSERVLELQVLLKPGYEEVDSSELQSAFGSIFVADRAFHDGLVPVLLLEARTLLIAGKSRPDSSKDELEALSKFKKVMHLKPLNVDAGDGLVEIAEYFLAQANEKFSQEKYEIAVHLADYGLLADEFNESLIEIRSKSTNKLEGDQKLIQESLQEAQLALREDRFLLPSDSNAKQKFEEVLKLDPNNTQASEGLSLLPNQVINKIIQLRNQKNWTEAWDVANAAKDEFSKNPEQYKDYIPRFEEYTANFDARLGRLRMLLDVLQSLLNEQDISLVTIDKAADIFKELNDEYPSETAADDEQVRWLGLLEKKESIELINQALKHFPNGPELLKLQQKQLEQDRFAKLDTNDGELEIVILPWGEVLEILDKNGVDVADPDSTGLTPKTVSLPKGSYTLIIRTLTEETQEIPAEVKAQKLILVLRNFGNVTAENYFEKASW